MPSRSKVSSLVLILVLAFVWGYKRDALLQAWASWGTAAPAESSAPVAQSLAAEVPVAPPPTAPAQPGLAPPPRAPAPPPGPAAQNPPTQNNLTTTLDSIRPGQIQQEQIVQRNAYFEKLSQQLRELQGGTPPPPGANPPTEPDPPPPPVDPSVNAVAPPPPPGVPQADFDQATLDDQEPEMIEDADDEADVDEPDDPADQME